MNATIQEDIKEITAPTKRKFNLGEVLKQLRQLFCDVRHCGATYRLLCLFFAIINIYYFGLYNSSQLKGDPIKIVIMFGLAEVLGIVIGEKVVHILSHGNTKIAMVSSLVIITICSSCIKFLNLSEQSVLIFFLVEIFFIGNAFNLVFSIQDEQVAPKLLGVSFEVNYSFGQLTTLACPIIAKM